MRQKKLKILFVLFSILLIFLILLKISLQIQPRVSLDLSLIPQEGNSQSNLVLIIKSNRNINDVSGRIIIPEGFEVISGNPEWETDLFNDKEKTIEVSIRPVIEGEWQIDAFAEGYSSVQIKTSVNSRLEVEPITKVSSEDITEVHETWEEWFARKKRHMEENPDNYYRACFDIEGCRIPEQLKGSQLNDYFKSLNLTNDPVYVMIQFDVLGGDPSWVQVNLLKLNGLTLLGLGGGGHTYYAKASKSFLENKNYDFIRWIGIKDSESKIPGVLNEKLNQKCNGEIELIVSLYEGLNIEQMNEFNEIGIQIIRGDIGEDLLQINSNLESIKTVSMLNFVEEIELVYTGGICPPGSINCGNDPLSVISCKL